MFIYDLQCVDLDTFGLNPHRLVVSCHTNGHVSIVFNISNEQYTTESAIRGFLWMLFGVYYDVLPFGCG